MVLISYRYSFPRRSLLTKTNSFRRTLRQAVTARVKVDIYLLRFSIQFIFYHRHASLPVCKWYREGKQWWDMGWADSIILPFTLNWLASLQD